MSIENPQLGNDILINEEEDDWVLAPDGDVSLTMDGAITLLQDIRHGLDNIPGELLGHKDAGAGRPFVKLEVQFIWRNQ